MCSKFGLLQRTRSGRSREVGPRQPSGAIRHMDFIEVESKARVLSSGWLWQQLADCDGNDTAPENRWYPDNFLFPCPFVAFEMQLVTTVTVLSW